MTHSTLSRRSFRPVADTLEGRLCLSGAAATAHAAGLVPAISPHHLQAVVQGIATVRNTTFQTLTMVLENTAAHHIFEKVIPAGHTLSFEVVQSPATYIRVATRSKSIANHGVTHNPTSVLAPNRAYRIIDVVGQGYTFVSP